MGGGGCTRKDCVVLSGESSGNIPAIAILELVGEFAEEGCTLGIVSIVLLEMLAPCG